MPKNFAAFCVLCLDYTPLVPGQSRIKPLQQNLPFYFSETHNIKISSLPRSFRCSLYVRNGLNENEKVIYGRNEGSFTAVTVVFAVERKFHLFRIICTQEPTLSSILQHY